ncbi:hypothetical protein D1AOALGA4SA_2386 [Olavius algarvensis Delta 1 endosymbiont]|nr:hypothetical protein D1AOALGA4SA_2386 [Olavius algarvensis Delta 1 endosymbiont]
MPNFIIRYFLFDILRFVFKFSCFIRALPLAKKTASLIGEKKLMNVEHRTSNIEHRIMYSVCLKRLSGLWGRSSKSEAPSESIIRQSTFVIPM